MSEKFKMGRTIETDGQDAELSDVSGMMELTPKKKKKGKIIIRKSGKPAKENIIDARAYTDKTGKETMEKGRLEYEKKIGEMLKGLK